MNIKDMQAKVAEFQKAFGHPVGDKPKMIKTERHEIRTDWLQEEVDELWHAETLVDVADALGDVIYIALGTAIEYGIDLEPVLNIIHEANMSKLGPDGKPIYKADNKIAKPEGWQPPEPKIEAELDRQVNQK